MNIGNVSALGQHFINGLSAKDSHMATASSVITAICHADITDIARMNQKLDLGRVTKSIW